MAKNSRRDNKMQWRKAGYEPTPIVVAIAGMLSLASAMGIGRFAFTPLLPMMLHDQIVTLAEGSWLATANYIGYFIGAALCTLLPLYFANRLLPTALGAIASPPIIVRTGLIVTALLTFAMATESPWIWPILRFLSGIASAVCFVFTSTWCLKLLIKLDKPQLAGLIYCGPGIGIIVTGLSASVMVSGDWRAQTAWATFGILAAILAILVWQVMRPDVLKAVQKKIPTLHAAETESRPHYNLLSGGKEEVLILTVAYGCAGFGYIITATFLPVIARHALPGSIWPDIFWPVFGFGVVCGGLISTRLPIRWDQRDLLIASYAIQGSGVMLGLWYPGITGFILSSFLVGAPLTAITLFAMREVNRLNAQLAASFMGLLTATYGIGQILGPPVATALVQRSDGHADFTFSLEVATLILLVGACMFLWLRLRYPLNCR